MKNWAAFRWSRLSTRLHRIETNTWAGIEWFFDEVATSIVSCDGGIDFNAAIKTARADSVSPSQNVTI